MIKWRKRRQRDVCGRNVEVGHVNNVPRIQKGTRKYQSTPRIKDCRCEKGQIQRDVNVQALPRLADASQDTHSRIVCTSNAPVWNGSLIKLGPEGVQEKGQHHHAKGPSNRNGSTDGSSKSNAITRRGLDKILDGGEAQEAEDFTPVP